MTTTLDQDLGPLVSATTAQTVVAVAQEAAELDQVAKALRGLAVAGHQVVLLWWRGEPGERLSSFGARVQISDAPRSRSLPGRVRQAVRAPRQALAGRPTTLLGAVEHDPRALRTLEGADLVVAVGAPAQAVGADLAAAAGGPLATPAGLEEWEVVSGLWRKLETQVEIGPGAFTPRYVRSLLRHLSMLVAPVPAARQRLLVPVVDTMHQTGRFDLAHDLAAYLDPAAPGLEPAEQARWRGLKVLTQTSATGDPHPELSDAAAELLRAADAALVSDPAVDLTVDLTHLALSLLFHRELHADKLSSPLVDDPDAFLADVRASRVGELLAGSAPRQAPLPSRSRVARSGDGTDEAGYAARPRVVVVPGTYQQFSAPVIDALAERAEVRTVDLAARPDLRGLGPRRALVEARLRQALGAPTLPDYEILEEMEAADAVFVDWADRGALATVMAVPEGVRLVLRIHSMDALSPWIHLLDWSRVDDLVVVSAPMQVLVERLLGDRLAGTRVHVVPNVLDPSRLPTTGPTEGHLRRLLVVGWGQQVKDARWALDILGALRADDPSWRLSLLGGDFPADTVSSQRAYARDFRARLAAQDVRGAVDFVGFTRDVAPHLAAAGFVLSTSRRESFGLGLVEAAAAGVVPVVRNWPIYAPLDAARSLFPHHWVVDSVEEAVARIRAAAQEPAWSEASAEARAVVDERFSSGDARAAFQELLLGRP